MLETSLAEGPQIVTKRGVETAVLVPIEHWRRLETMAKPNLKELLLAPEPRTDELTPPPPKRMNWKIGLSAFSPPTTSWNWMRPSSESGQG